jgi:thiol-disulfide isomerase/thioredoxin
MTSVATRPKQPPRSPKRRRGRGDSQRSTWVWVAAVTVVLCAAIIAVFATHDTKTSTAPGVEQTRAVQASGTALPPLPTGGADGAVGQLMPELHGASFDGTPVSVTRDGRAKLVLFVAHWCPHCRREVPVIVQHLRTRTTPAGIDLVAVSTDVADVRPNYPPSAWLADEAWPITTLADSADNTAAAAFGVSAFPYFVAVDASGKVVARTSGEISMDTFDQLMGQALGAG